MEKNTFNSFSITVQGRLVEFSRPAVMGILNVTDDSFYDGGRYREPEAMLAQARKLLADGADIIDIGASSSRPGATLIPQDEEARRLTEAVGLLRREMPDCIISVDTCFAAPARAAIEAGADIINDIGGGELDCDRKGANDAQGGVSKMFATVAELQVPYIMMHGGREHVNHEPYMEDDRLIDSMVQFFSRRLDTLYRLGVKDVWIDPGFGFGKTVEQNHMLLDRLDELTTLFREPLLAALSRKSMIYRPLGITPDEALDGTIALDAIALDRGARIVRVHDVKPAVQTINLLGLVKD
ncbi:MAG: dihydropteroate synthase [Bacteroidales bacterium]|nr:dihydropteroate synthase [Bacteroidales bacterium]